MKLTCFGKYGPYPKGGCATSCYMITHEGKNILLDLGSGALSKVLQKIRVQDIHALLLSHLHSDHMGDALTLRYALAAGKKMGHLSDSIPVYLPEFPLKESSMLSENVMMDTKFITDGMQCNIFGIDVIFARMPHAVPSYAMSFCADGKKFVYSGDTQDNDKLAVFAKDADLFLMDAALLSKDKSEDAAHVSAKDAGRIGKDSNAKRMLITHLFPEYDKDMILKEAREGYSKAEFIEEKIIYEV